MLTIHNQSVKMFVYVQVKNLILVDTPHVGKGNSLLYYGFFSTSVFFSCLERERTQFQMRDVKI